MDAGRSENRIEVIHRLVTDEYGENYWFNGCAGYVMECLGERDYDYWFFAGMTGDLFTQHYTYTKYSGDALSCYRMDEDPDQFVAETFAECGYGAMYISRQELERDTEMYLRRLKAYIDRGIPVIAWGQITGVYVGYQERGRILLYISGNSDQPRRITLEEAVRKTQGGTENPQGQGGWIFVGEKRETPSLAEIYRRAAVGLSRYFHVRTDEYCFGPEAFRAWAADIENGKFDGMRDEEFDAWGHYTNFLCVLATNGSCSHVFFERARKLNPDLVWLDRVEEQYRRMGRMWNDNSVNDLETLGGGFNVTLEILRDREKRTKIAKVLRKCGECMDTAEGILKENRETRLL